MAEKYPESVDIHYVLSLHLVMYQTTETRFVPLSVN